jgi:RNA polymerase sigma-70 factor (ECF subfamily)
VTDDRQVAEPTDEVLMTRVQAADQAALGRLFERYAGLIRGVASRIIRNATEAEDVVQDLFIFIQRKAAIFDRSKSTARSWIIQMAYHRAIDRRRYLTSRHFYTREDIEDKTVGMSAKLVDERDYSAEVVFGRDGVKKLL